MTYEQRDVAFRAAEAAGIDGGVVLLDTRLRHLVEEMDDLRDDARVDHGAAVRDGADGVAELRDGDALEQVAGSAVFQRVEHVLVIVERREDDDADLRPLLLYGVCCRHAVELRHADVHEHDVRRRLLDEGEELGAVLREARDLHIGVLAEDDAEALADELLVVGDHDA